jgi:MFS family permease
MGKSSRMYRQTMLVSLASGIFALGTGTIWFMLPVLINDMLGSIFLMSIALVIPNIVAIIFDIPMGELSDKVGRKKLTLISIIMMLILGLTLRYITNIPELILFLIALGFTNLIIASPMRAWVMELSVRKKSGQSWGLFEGMMDLGFTIAPLFAGFILSTYITDGAFYLGMFVVIMAFVAMMLLLLAQDTVKHTLKMLKSIIKVIFEDKMYITGFRNFSQLRGIGIAVLLSIFIFVFVDGVVWAIEPLLATTGFSVMIVGIILTAHQLGSLAEIPAGVIADKFGKNKMLIIGILISALFFTLFGFICNSNVESPVAVTLSYPDLPIGPFELAMTYQDIWCIITMFIAAAGLACAGPAAAGLLTDSSTKLQHGAITGVWGTVEDFSYIVSPIIAGFVAETYGLGMSFVLLGGICLALLPILVILLKDTN